MKVEGGRGKERMKAEVGRWKSEKKDLRDSRSSAFRLPPSALRHFLRYWLPLIAYCLFIFIQSSFESPLNLPSIVHIDKGLHIGGYGLLGFLFYRAYRSSWPSASVWRTANASLLSAGFYGMTDEIHQYFVPGRSADPWDWLADMVGAMLGVVAYHVWLYVQASRASSSIPVRLTKQAGLDK
jgi:VanZ family protein